MVLRDEFEQLDTEWGDREYALLSILEEVSSEDNIDRTLAAYMADIVELFEE